MSDKSEMLRQEKYQNQFHHRGDIANDEVE